MRRLFSEFRHSRIRDDDGELFHIAECYDRVTKYNGKRCWIQIKSEGLGPLSWILNAMQRLPAS